MNIYVALFSTAILSFLIAFLLGFVLIPWLRKLKFGQTILDIGPAPFHMIEEVAAEVYPGIGICPYVMTGGTDAKFYRELSENCLRFAPLYINSQQYASIHGLNENISQGALPMGVDFYKKMIERS